MSASERYPNGAEIRHVPQPFPDRGRKPYTPQKSMTIAVGFLCENGNHLILAADRQITAHGAYKITREKYATKRHGLLELTCFYSGEPGTFAKFMQSVDALLSAQADVTPEIVQDTMESVIETMRLNDVLLDPRFWLLAGISELFEHPKLVVFDGKYLFNAQNGVQIIGCGDTSLVNFLGDRLYSPEMTATQGVALGAYLIKKATQYVDGCGEPIDVLRIDDAGSWTETPKHVRNHIAAIEEQEQFLSTLMVQKPFAP